MTRNDVLEIVGLLAMIVGAGVLFYALYRLDAELALMVLALLLMAVGAFVVRQVHRGDA